MQEDGGMTSPRKLAGVRLYVEQINYKFSSATFMKSLAAHVAQKMFLLKMIFYFVCLAVSPAHMTLYYYMCAWCPGRPEEGIRYPGTGVIEGCESPCG